ncbi:MAG TPA: M14 family zinc carboxypeptidase, partial [Bacteroidia bacterium]|nr:M14 family zinc carboxypeptidase [Bacteroidia bacterium]
MTYIECINFYKQLETKYKNSKLFEYGLTDVGIPLHVFMITDDGDFNLESIRKKGKAILLVNNGIHAGEPCGVDASLSLSEDLLQAKIDQNYLKNLVVCIIPFYNIDGALNRGCCSRFNQNGPLEHGFRANAKNLDLNRDFIKCDAQNTKSLIQIIQQLKPQIFIDTHISNGADYTYNMTLIATQHNKLHPELGKFLSTKMLPALYDDMKNKKNEMCPYVDTKDNTPDSGLVGFLETPRFASGYAALHNILGFVTEAHMLKPYPIQVKATYDLLMSIINYTNKKAT